MTGCALSYCGTRVTGCALCYRVVTSYWIFNGATCNTKNLSRSSVEVISAGTPAIRHIHVKTEYPKPNRPSATLCPTQIAYDVAWNEGRTPAMTDPLSHGTARHVSHLTFTVYSPSTWLAVFRNAFGTYFTSVCVVPVDDGSPAEFSLSSCLLRSLA